MEMRVNIREKWWGDPRREALAKRLGSSEMADGIAVKFWRLAHYYGLIPLSTYETILETKDLLDSKLAEIRPEGLYIKGSSLKSPSKPKGCLEDFHDDEVKALLTENVSIPTQKRWLKLYKEADWIEEEVLRVLTYYDTNQRKRPKSKRGWSMAINNWLSRGWDWRRKGIKPQEKNLIEFLKVVK